MTDVFGGTRPRRWLVAIVSAVVLTGCAETGVSSIAPGPGDVPPVNMPAAVNTTMQGFSIHLDPTVMLWARDAHVDLKAVVEKTLSDVESRLNGTHATIDISAGSVYAIPDIGIGGYTDPYTGNIRISMDSRSRVPLHRMLSVWIPLSMAHELHHSTRILDGPGYGTTLLDAMVAEGSAEAFVRETYPDAPPIPWVQPLAKQREVAAWHLARTALSRTDDLTLHQRWFFGAADVPRWAGYKIGYRIATAYLARHPSVRAEKLATLATSVIYRGSHYAP